ncbi:hypothetical protein LZ30DRAFT_608268 [Colletotrichum cereale]|nr:hypothetical protein LZ30DRAFT_608268 [Colletotrichum cereale]
MHLLDFPDNQGDASTSPFIEDWITHLCYPDLDCLIMSRTPSPAKRKGPHEDLEATPTNPPSFSRFTFDNASISTSDTASDSGQSGASRRSASPKKRERELRRATEYPLRRDKVTNRPDPTSLMRELYALQDAPVIPSTVKVCAALTKDSSWGNQPRDAWFYTASSDESTQQSSFDSDMYTYRRLCKIREKAIRCGTQMEHEAGWNDSVHAPLLEVALDDEPSVSYRNVTSCRVLPNFRREDQWLNVKIDYAILLDFSPESDFTSTVEAYRKSDAGTHHVTYIQLPDNPDTPAAIPIETKSANAEMVSGPAQLAAWARTHFDFLSRLPSAAQLPVLPVIFVHGARWRVDFAERAHGKLVSSVLLPRA